MLKISDLQVELEKGLERYLTDFLVDGKPFLPAQLRPKVQLLYPTGRQLPRTALATKDWDPENGDQVLISFVPAGEATAPDPEPAAEEVEEADRQPVHNFHTQARREIAREREYLQREREYIPREREYIPREREYPRERDFNREYASEPPRRSAFPRPRPVMYKEPDPGAMSDLIRALYRVESSPGFQFVALKWFRDVALPREGFGWAFAPEIRDRVLRDATATELVLTSKVDNPKSPFPTTAIRVNRDHPRVREILAEPLDEETVQPPASKNRGEAPEMGEGDEKIEA